MTAVKAAPTLNISEAAWQSRVMNFARVKRWRVAHQRPARTTQGWRTATEGDIGLPDLTLARDGVVLLVELKSQGGRATPAQRAWLMAAGGNGYLWRPSNWSEVMAVLS